MAASAEIRRYWDRVADLGCCVCQGVPATIHHVHGGSCSGLSGMGMKTNDWLVVPLCMTHHTGDRGIDSGQGIFRSVSAWEDANGWQLVHLINVAMTLRVDIFERAGVDFHRLWCSGFSRVASRPPSNTPTFR